MPEAYGDTGGSGIPGSKPPHDARRGCCPDTGTVWERAGSRVCRSVHAGVLASWFQQQYVGTVEGS